VQKIFKASLAELEATGIQTVSAQSLGTGQSMELAHDELGRVAAAGVSVVCMDEFHLPRTAETDLRSTAGSLCARECGSDHPTRGRGRRHPPSRALRTGDGERLACDLAVRGLVIFSGLARGVDAAAHRGAINARGKTVAVSGTGVDIIYPQENTRLAEQMLALGGALISEFPMNAFAAPQDFPIRSRIIGGVSIGVLVLEADEYSGTRITSRCALEQDREVFAVPGNVTNKNSWGPNTLIKQGARLTATWEDVWEELPAPVRLALTPATGDESQAGKTASLFGESELPPQKRKILKLLKADEATHIDEIVERLEPLVIRDIRSAVRAGAGGEGQVYAGEEFCEELCAVSSWLLA